MVSLWWDHAHIMYSHRIKRRFYLDDTRSRTFITKTQVPLVAKKQRHDPFQCIRSLTLTRQERFQRLRCDHVFHTRCVDTWLRRNQDDCPLCKSTRQLMTIYDDDTQRKKRDLAWFELVGSVSRETKFTWIENGNVNKFVHHYRCLE
ncbi:hypothetical protein FCULG_00011274 [Fusarium culmorum]|uniref:RING-type domain-containing protein n=1 Tax=Fusarium culmorum TaxID=5516 RepID=A0A2T4H5S7_FUSCU|nr:hypothetical protein FCULG_00011274 [Fusarium culmorum]